MRKVMSLFLLSIFIILVSQSCGLPSKTESMSSDLSQKQIETTEKSEKSPLTKLLSHHENDPGAYSVDCNNSFSRPASTMTVSTDAYYFIDKVGTVSRIMYIDRKSGQSGPLCGKADCRHNSGDCNACIVNSGNIYGLSWYNGQLFWLTEVIGSGGIENGYHVFSCNSDGTGRKDVRLISETQGMNSEIPGGNTFACFHRGYLFICGETGISNIVNAVPVRKIRILAYSMNDPQKDRILEEIEVSDQPKMAAMQASGDYLYYCWYTLSGDEAGNSYSDQITIKKYSITNDCTEMVAELYNEEYKDFCPFGIWVKDQAMLFATFDSVLYSYDFRGRQLRPLEGFADKPFGLWYLSDGMMISLGRKVRAYDYDGNLIHEVASMDAPGLRMTVYGADAGGVFYYGLDENVRRFVSCYSYDSGDEIVLWEE